MRKKGLTIHVLFFLLLFDMIKGRYNYYDPEYDPQVTEGNELLLMVEGEKFSFVVLQTESKKVLIWGEDFDSDELENPRSLGVILTAPYSDIKAIVPSSSFFIIPKELYTENGLEDFARFLTLEPGDSILVNELDQNSNVIFKVTESELKTLENRVDKQNIFFAGKAFSAAIIAAKPDNHNFYVHVEDTQLQLLFMQNSAVRYYNSFEFKNPDELMYFIVLAANELNLDLSETSVFFSGDVNISDKKLQRVSDLLPKIYLNQARIVVLPQGFLPHQILLLSGLTLCGSLVED
jgi:hypothetical protein